MLELRERYMAERAAAVIAGASQTLIYAHLGHVMACPTRRGSSDPLFIPMGMQLRRRVGGGLRVIGMTAATVQAPLPLGSTYGTLDEMLARAGEGSFRLDLRAAPRGWVDREQSWSINFTDRLHAVPRTACDVLISVPRLTAAARY